MIQTVDQWLRITQTFGKPKDHNGIDYAIYSGTPLKIMAPGEVVWAGWNTQGYGNLVKVQHPGGYTTYLAHLSEVWVSVGQHVEAGQWAGLSGSTGNSTGPHVHVELRYNNRAINPWPYYVAVAPDGTPTLPPPPYYPPATPPATPPDEPDIDPRPPVIERPEQEREAIIRAKIKQEREAARRAAKKKKGR